jgi:PAS domain S-box-containing protein
VKPEEERIVTEKPMPPTSGVLEVLTAARDYSAAIVETVLEPLLVLDHNLVALSANRAFYRVFRTAPEEVEGHHVFALAGGQWDIPELRQLLEALRAHNSPFEGYEVTHEFGRIGRRTFRLNARAIVQPGSDHRNVLLALDDITEQKLAEERIQQAAKMQAIGQLAGGMAHEINNQITALIGFTQFVVGSLPPSDPRQADLAQVTKAAERVAYITRQLLIFSRQELGERIALNPNMLLAGMEGMLQRLLGADVTCVLTLDPHVGLVETIPAQLEGVIVNLALNARDAMSRSGRFTISTAPLTVDESRVRAHREVTVPLGPYVRITVSDTGTGMDEVTRHRAFEPFFTTKPVGQGTGLGLASVYGAVKQSRGFIWLESETGRGTTFFIDLPVAEGAETRVQPPSESPSAAHSGELILVVEDEEIVRTWITRMLEHRGYRVIAVASAAAALDAVERESALDAVLTDLAMPGMSGRELAQQVHERRPGLPVLGMTGYSDDQVTRRGLSAPGVPVLHKPFTAEVLVRALRKVLETRPRGTAPRGPDGLEPEGHG